MTLLSQNTPEHAPAQCSPLGHVHVKISRRNRTTRNLAVWMVPSTDQTGREPIIERNHRRFLRHTGAICNKWATLMTSRHQVVDSDQRYGIARGSASNRRDTSDHKKTSDQKPRIRRNAACGPACRRQSLTVKCGSPNPQRGARDHAIDEGGLQAGFAPPRWRNIIAVVDNDARGRRTQARLNFALECGELHMTCWLLGVEWKAARDARTARRARELLSPISRELGHASRSHCPFQCRRFLNTCQCRRFFCTSGAMFDQNPSDCLQHVS